MKTFVLAALAALSLSIGSANAQNLTRGNQPQVTHWGSPTSGDASGG